MKKITALWHVILSRGAAKNPGYAGKTPDLRRDSLLRMTWAWRTSLIIIVMAASLLFNAEQAQAQSGVELTNVGTVVQYGESITFLAEIKTSIQIRQASIIVLDEVQGLIQVLPLTVTPEGRAEYRFDTRQNLLRPFSTVRWYYEFALEDGTTVQSDEYSVQYEDNLFQWQALEAGTIKVHWYGGDANFGAGAMNAAQAGLASINRILPLDLTQPVDIYLYASESDLQATLDPSGEAWVAGHADPALGIVTAVITPGAEQTIFMERAIPHELMHVLLYRSIGAGYANIPAWLSEGLAALTELSPNPDYDRALNDAGQKNGLIPLSDLCGSFSASVDQAFLVYAESRSFTNYLLTTYGSSGLMTLASTYADGVDCEHGTERVFGASLSQLELGWRSSIPGQSPLNLTLDSTAPYLVLLCLVLSIPLIAILSTSRRKGNPHGP